MCVLALILGKLKLKARHDPTRLLSPKRNVSSDGEVDVNGKPWWRRRLIEYKRELRLSALLCMLHATDFSACVDGHSKK